MKKLLVSLMALSVLSIGTAASAGPLSDALNKASATVTRHENNMTQAQKDAQARQKAREAEIAKQQKEWAKKQEQAKKDAEARKKAREAELAKQKKAIEAKQAQARKDVEAKKKEIAKKQEQAQ